MWVPLDPVQQTRLPLRQFHKFLNEPFVAQRPVKRVVLVRVRQKRRKVRQKKLVKVVAKAKPFARVFPLVVKV